MDLVKVIAAEHVRDFIIKIKFNDGLVAEIDFEKELWGEIFTPLKMDKKFFTQFSLNPWTLEWPKWSRFCSGVSS